MAREEEQPVYCSLGTRSRGRDRHQWEERRTRAAEFRETGRTQDQDFWPRCQCLEMETGREENECEDP